MPASSPCRHAAPPCPSRPGASACRAAPVVIVHGTEDDLVPVANVAYMQAHLTGARCVKTMLLQGQNHFLPWNSVATVREAIRLAQEGAC